MIDGYFKARIDLFWDRIGHYLVALNLSANNITWAGLILILVNCLLYVFHKNNFYFGLLLAFCFAFDALDGAVARVTKTTSKYGGYLDAVIDRYQELAIYFTIAYVNEYWLAGFVAITGSFLVSYNKARTAVEIPIDNDKWPDLTERFERIILICTGLILEPAIVLPDYLKYDFLFYMVLVIGILAHITAIQRFIRAKNMLTKS